jgi:hypothetical protein
VVEKRGRKSAADRADIIPLDLPDTRPPPPEDLSPRAAQAWRDATAVMPPNHFDGAKQLVLRGYVNHIVAAEAIWPRYLAALETPGFDPKRLIELQKMFDRESNGVRHAGRHLGLLQVARHSRRVPRYAPTPAPTPWET